MLIYDPAGRISAKQAMRHEYFTAGDSEMASPDNRARVFR